MLEKKGQNDVNIYIPEVASATAEVTIDEVINAVLKYQPHADVELVRKAYELANAAHGGQKRASGEDYIIHPLCVAKILTELQIDSTTITAALLHDVVEDTDHTIEEIKEMNEEMDIPEHFDFIKDEDIPTIVERALKEGNPLYPVPKIMDKEDCTKVVKAIRGF